MLLYRGHTSAFHTATASSSRSIAWRDRDLGRPAVPAHQLRGALDGVPDMEQLPDQVLIRPSVHRWSLANPCASGPFRSSSSSRAHCCALSRARDTGPLEPQRLRPAVLPGPLPPPHRPLGDPQSAAISLIASPRANLPAASSRSRSRRCCSAGVYPPRCAYRMHPAYRRKQDTSPPRTSPIKGL